MKIYVVVLLNISKGEHHIVGDYDSKEKAEARIEELKAEEDGTENIVYDVMEFES